MARVRPPMLSGTEFVPRQRAGLGLDRLLGSGLRHLDGGVLASLRGRCCRRHPPPTCGGCPWPPSGCAAAGASGEGAYAWIRFGPRLRCPKQRGPKPRCRQPSCAVLKSTSWIQSFRLLKSLESYNRRTARRRKKSPRRGRRCTSSSESISIWSMKCRGLPLQHVLFRVVKTTERAVRFPRGGSPCPCPISSSSAKVSGCTNSATGRCLGVGWRYWPNVTTWQPTDSQVFHGFHHLVERLSQTEHHATLGAQGRRRRGA